MLGQVEPALVGLGTALGGEPEGKLRQLGGRVGRSAQSGLAGSDLDRLRHLRVRTIAGQGEVASLLLGIGNDVGERSVGLAPAAQRRGRVDRGGEERVRELDPPVDADPHESRLLGRRQCARVDQVQIGSRQCGRA